MGVASVCPAGGVQLLQEIKEVVIKSIMWDDSARKIYCSNKISVLVLLQALVIIRG